MARRKKAALLPNNIVLLQNLVKRDPLSYKEEFLQQLRHYESQKDIFMSNPESYENIEFAELIDFLAHVCDCYPKETEKIPDDLAGLLSEHHQELNPIIRDKIVTSLVLIRNKNKITCEKLIQILFPILISTPSKRLRNQIYNQIIISIKNANTNSVNQKLNRAVQTLLFNLLAQQDASSIWATRITRELWRRAIWADSRSVEIMKQACLLMDLKVAISGAKFFLGVDKEKEEYLEEDSEEDEDLSTIKHKIGINKKTSKRSKQMENALKTFKKKEKGKNANVQLNFSALHLLNDPQGFAERVFTFQLSKGNNRLNLEQKIVFLNLVSRLIGTHKLSVLGFYSYLLKYLTPKQRDVTQFLAAAAQASHDLVPPDALQPVIRRIADEFVSDGVSAEVATAGLNTIREILTRSPLAIETDLLQDLTEYKGSKSKSVMVAARGLIGLYREVAPEMLKRKDRGKDASMNLASGEHKSVAKFGEENVQDSIAGIEMLEKWRKEQGLNDEDEEIDDWEVASDLSSDESESGWVNMESDKEYNVSDSDEDSDEDEDKNKNKDKEKVGTNESSVDTMSLMARKILTPADFAKLDELKTLAGVEKILHKNKGLNRNEDEVEATSLLGPKTYKATKEERMESIKEGREGRKEYGSRKGRRDNSHSTTNKEKARKKNFMMMVHKKEVQGKSKRSLVVKQKILKAHLEKQRKKGF